MSASKAETTAAILLLNRDDAPYAFRATPTGVIGQWDYADAKWAGPLGAGSIDRTYELHVELRDDGTYVTHDQTDDLEAGIGLGGAGMTRTKFRGRVYRRSYSSSAAPIASDHGRIGHTFGWNFTTDEIKKPVTETLERLGWTRKRGFWARLFGA